MNRAARSSKTSHSQLAGTAASDLLLPIRSPEPCGASLEYDAEYAVLQSRMTARGETQYGRFVGAAEPPNWAEVERDSRRLLLRTKDINVFVWLCRARTRLGQAAGLAQTLETLVSALQAWPEDIHPQLLVEGQADPDVRANALAALADPEGLLTDVRDIVVDSSSAFRLTVRDVERALTVPRLADAQNPESVNQQIAGLRAAHAGDAAASVNLLAEAARHAQAIDAWSRHQLGDGAPSLQGLMRVLEPFRSPSAERDSVEAAKGRSRPQTRDIPKSDRARPSKLLICSEGGGQVATRNEMLDVIREAREWFETHEPSSPVPALLKQAERMVGKSFLQVADTIPLDLLRKWETEEDEASLEKASKAARSGSA